MPSAKNVATEVLPLAPARNKLIKIAPFLGLPISAPAFEASDFAINPCFYIWKEKFSRTNDSISSSDPSSGTAKGFITSLPVWSLIMTLC